ncbi:hypothetical protein [Streptomyces cinereoruber]|uniref:hypothetical protein n=1 Tax=Streptomyces cinereoruber TaxID=67260 RepID=UPI0033995F80
MATTPDRSSSPAPSKGAPAPIVKVRPGPYKNSIKDLEVKDGANSKHRGIKLALPVDVLRKGAKEPEQQTLQCVYRFEPDPHEEPKYNKQQEAFYQNAAACLVANVTQHGKLPEVSDKFEVVFAKTTFILTAMQHPIGHGFKMKTAPDGPPSDGH